MATFKVYLRPKNWRGDPKNLPEPTYILNKANKTDVWVYLHKDLKVLPQLNTEHMKKFVILEVP